MPRRRSHRPLDHARGALDLLDHQRRHGCGETPRPDEPLDEAHPSLARRLAGAQRVVQLAEVLVEGPRLVQQAAVLDAQVLEVKRLLLPAGELVR